ncbi:MAG: T9SS type A sorting domain-containing protein [Bacteroidales bacterium]|jgi:hypothetical protein|nr:T9SS type A sorting domain-containing protein [Bacteroidales bacterium]
MKRITTKTSRFKTVLTLAAILLVARNTHLQAQAEYHPITDGCIWSVSNEKYKTAGDTVLNGKTYMKVYRQVSVQPFEFSMEDAEYFAAIRNDSAGKRVYAFIPSGTWIWDLRDYSAIQTDTAMDVLIYDFSLNVGDTVYYYMLGDNIVKSVAVRVETADIYVGVNGYSTEGHHFSEMDTLAFLSDSTPCHQIFLHDISYLSQGKAWIESIGCIRGFGEGPQSLVSDYGYRTLLCFLDNFGNTLQTDFDFDDNSSDCFNKGFGGGVEDLEKLNLKTYPNPVTEQLHLYIGETEDKDITINIFNIMGVCVYRNILAGTGSDVEIDLHHLPNGMYTVVLETSDKKTSHKIIKI